MNRCVFLVILGFVAALAGGILLASNMGFKGAYTLDAATEGVSISGTNTLSRPYVHPEAGTASELMNDIGFADVAEVSRFLELGDSFETYTGRKGSPGPDFALAATEGLLVKMTNTKDYVIVGSHDPGISTTLDAAGAASTSGTNFVAYPYHSVASKASELMDDIGFVDVAEVSRFLKLDDAFETYTGRKGSPAADFALAPGEAYFIKMSATVDYVPTHY